ncbi:MAG: acetyl-CoA carboxylase biotin carboxyl carrier protein [Eubacteriales bacterium]|nr:acetyl-CoA carboxylase biotin carboxyl carrier protein [Eubacteriales bacterium]
MELDNILKIIDAVSESSLTNFSLEDGSVKLSLGVERTNVVVDSNAAIQLAPSVSSNAAQLDSDAQAGTADKAAFSGNVVKSPLVGIFYSSSAPDAKPYVSVGDTVKKGQVLGIIEAMKLMNEIESEYDGVVKEILIDNEQMAEYGQPLFVIE